MVLDLVAAKGIRMTSEIDVFLTLVFFCGVCWREGIFYNKKKLHWFSRIFTTVGGGAHGKFSSHSRKTTPVSSR